MLSSRHRVVPIACAFCQRRRAPFCFCAVCPGTLRLCLECLGGGVESASHPQHRREHAYRVAHYLGATSLYDHEWSVAEELALVDAVYAAGLGNWPDTAARVGSKSDAECASHYARVYLDSPRAPLPALGAVPSPIGAAAVAALGEAGDATAAGRAAAAAAHEMAATLCTDREVPRPVGHGEAQHPLSGMGGRSNTRVSATPGYPTAHVPRSDIAGFLPLRGDFDIEWENDAVRGVVSWIGKGA